MCAYFSNESIVLFNITNVISSKNGLSMQKGNKYKYIILKNIYFTQKTMKTAIFDYKLAKSKKYVWEISDIIQM